MSTAGYGSGPDLSEKFQEFLSGAARLVLGLGALAMLVSIGLLVFNSFRLSGGVAAASVTDALRITEVMHKVLLAGTIGVAISTTYLYWGEEILGAIQLMGAAALYFAPLYLPMVIGDTSNEAVARSMGSLQQAGMVLGLIAIVVLVIDIANRTRQRAKTGTKADQLKYGKGIKEEGTQNVFMGKCWQLPFCRKFVREKCPIYHSKRTCWKELVGCMCEESVIRSAMENKPISKEALLSGSAIPKSNRLTDAQKKERCKSCVIYNEHQRHKYKLAMPVVVGVFVLLYVVLRAPLLVATNELVTRINKAVQFGTLDAVKDLQPPAAFNEMMLFVLFVIALTYSMKVLEYLIFNAKV